MQYESINPPALPSSRPTSPRSPAFVCNHHLHHNLDLKNFVNVSDHISQKQAVLTFPDFVFMPYSANLLEGVS